MFYTASTVAAMGLFLNNFNVSRPVRSSTSHESSSVNTTFPATVYNDSFYYDSADTAYTSFNDWLASADRELEYLYRYEGKNNSYVDDGSTSSKSQGEEDSPDYPPVAYDYYTGVLGLLENKSSESINPYIITKNPKNVSRAEHLQQPCPDVNRVIRCFERICENKTVVAENYSGTI